MCGIAGAVFWNDTPRGADPRAIVEYMTRALAHRGPDGEGVVQCAAGAADSASARPTCVLGHRRLAIIDLSPRGAQPMASRDAPIWATYNGEIYNFRQVRRELERIGRVFRTDSDTEVLLQGYEEWGSRVIERLRGMFAFAIWDGQMNQLVVARDRLGIKPLYLYRTGDGVLFASELRALLASGLIPRRLDPVALDQFLSYQAVPPPRTLVQGIELLLPGHVAVATPPGRFEQHPYWDLLDCAEPFDGNGSDRDAIQRRVRELLLESIGLHLVSDVPVGVFLSGGVDSSAIVALMREAGVLPRTFCVTFPGTPFDESSYARAVATAFETDHVEIPLEAGSVPAQVAEAAASIDHPSGDGINTFVISRAVRAAGMKVTLSGLGGDEFFGGYPSFQRFAKYGSYARAWGRSPEPLRSGLAAAVRAVGDRTIGTLKTAALLESDGSLPQMFPIMRQLFSASQRSALLAPDVWRLAASAADPYVGLLRSAEERANGLGTMSLVSYAEARTYMHDVLLRDTDQMSMRWGLEVRVPLLDHRVVEYLMSLPDALKEPGDRPKGLLLDSLSRPLPDACVSRAKQGFVLPFDVWMRGELRAFCEQHLHTLGDRPFLRHEAVQEVWSSFLAGDRRVSWSRPWTLVAFDAWLEQTQIES
jgi:asparagine synthase (glutamine-hydrolysing)